MITLGITGRSGCGKSTVTAVFAGHGVPLADADQISREILLPGSPLLPALAERFGADILKADGTLDRRLLADRAFATPEGKAALDGLTHPEIVRRIRAQFPNIPILATGGPNDETILETIHAGANAITYSPPSNGELFAAIMQKYREKL